MDEPAPTLDYAKPTTPNKLKFAFTIEPIDGGLKFIKPSRQRFRRLGIVFGLIAAWFALATVMEVARTQFGLIAYWHQVILLVAGSLLIALGMRNQLKWGHRPIELEVRPESLQLVRPLALWSKRRAWKTQKIKRIKIVRNNETNAPLYDLVFVLGIRRYCVLSRLELGELENMAALIHKTTGVPVVNKLRKRA